MTRQMTATQLKAQLLRVLDEVSTGAEVEVTRHGRTVARLVPAGGSHASGSLIGMAMTAVEDEELFTTGASWEVE